VVENAAPNLVGPLAAAHNGTVDRGVLRREFGVRERWADTDSELLFAAIAECVETGPGVGDVDVAAAVGSVLGQVPGSAAVAVVDRRVPERVVLGTTFGALYVGWDESGSAWWVSEPEWFTQAGVGGREVQELQPGTVVVLHRGWVVDIRAEVVGAAHQPLPG
jgi:glutamine phosphoribosylpyrophosphate amidotransferase